MAIHITGAPCCWGVDDVKNPYLPKWQTVLEEAGKAGFRAIELGPYGYLPLDIDLVRYLRHQHKAAAAAARGGSAAQDTVSHRHGLGT